jgi:hypothetical protein
MVRNWNIYGTEKDSFLIQNIPRNPIISGTLTRHCLSGSEKMNRNDRKVSGKGYVPKHE